MSSKIKVDTIENVAGSGNVSLGSGHNLVVPGTLNITGASTFTGGVLTNTLNTASGTTITVPTGKTLVGTDAASIYAPGMVVQFVESSTTSNRAEISSSSFVSTNCFIDITPKFANSKNSSKTCKYN